MRCPDTNNRKILDLLVRTKNTALEKFRELEEIDETGRKGREEGCNIAC